MVARSVLNRSFTTEDGSQIRQATYAQRKGIAGRGQRGLVGPAGLVHHHWLLRVYLEGGAGMLPRQTTSSQAECFVVVCAFVSVQARELFNQRELAKFAVSFMRPPAGVRVGNSLRVGEAPIPVSLLFVDRHLGRADPGGSPSWHWVYCYKSMVPVRGVQALEAVLIPSQETDDTPTQGHTNTQYNRQTTLHSTTLPRY